MEYDPYLQQPSFIGEETLAKYIPIVTVQPMFPLYTGVGEIGVIMNKNGASVLLVSITMEVGVNIKNNPLTDEQERGKQPPDILNFFSCN